MKWVHALKLWNMHKKIYEPSHVYAIPRKGTAEIDDVKHIMMHEKLPGHLHKKAPLPSGVLEQLRSIEAEAKKRREASAPAGGKAETSAPALATSAKAKETSTLSSIPRVLPKPKATAEPKKSKLEILEESLAITKKSLANEKKKTKENRDDSLIEYMTKIMARYEKAIADEKK
jgi:hypothetical protein